ncbi:hypothetical protein Taro_014321 [Colocasia esculenta]|uniref:Uncharacterized protein n=1 Tax=Colocasia esculenta TaxID=4460 RepID=A0A843UII6_COLES|nr:hypothetical protein [Colocasia esculenta]
MIRPKLYKNLVRVVSTLDQVLSTPCSKHKTKSCKTGQVVSTQCIKYKAKRSSSVDTRSSSVDTRDSFQKHSGHYGTVVSTLDQLPETFWVKLGESVDTRWGTVDTRGFPRTPSGLFWDSRSTLAQAVSTLVALPEQNTWSDVTRKHVSCSDSLLTLITL